MCLDVSFTFFRYLLRICCVHTPHVWNTWKIGESESQWCWWWCRLYSSVLSMYMVHTKKVHCFVLFFLMEGGRSRGKWSLISDFFFCTHKLPRWLLDTAISCCCWFFARSKHNSSTKSTDSMALWDSCSVAKSDCNIVKRCVGYKCRNDNITKKEMATKCEKILCQWSTKNQASQKYPLPSPL